MTDLENLISLSGVSGTDRTDRALAALVAFADAGGPGDSAEPVTDILSDLLANLRHLAALGDLDYADANRRADMHFSAEVAEDERTPSYGG